MSMIERKQFMLSTIDNPFNPFVDFDNWYKFDNEKGYNSSGKLMRFVGDFPNDSTEKEQMEAVEAAIDKIIDLDFTDTFIKVESTIYYDENYAEKLENKTNGDEE